MNETKPLKPMVTAVTETDDMSMGVNLLVTETAWNLNQLSKHQFL
jgi:hypothetical protein